MQSRCSLEVNKHPRAGRGTQMEVMLMMMMVVVVVNLPGGHGGCQQDARIFTCEGSEVKNITRANIPTNTEELVLKQTGLTEVPGSAFANLPELMKIYIEENGELKSIAAFAFANLSKLTDISITKCRNLKVIHEDAFIGLVNLRIMRINDNGLTVFPNFTKINSNSSQHQFELLEFQGNRHIHSHRVPANAFRGLCSQPISEIRLNDNDIREIGSAAFNGTTMYKLNLSWNQKLSVMHPEAFLGSRGLVKLDISHTKLSSIPESILEELDSLIAKSAYHFKKLPPPDLFKKIRIANLTYPSHCCAFDNKGRNRTSHKIFCSRTKKDSAAYKIHCSNSTSVSCTPTPDAFNPCEDIMQQTYLRVLVWVISILALLGNTAVLLILIGTKAKLTVPRFLMCHLAFADLCMGVYLVVIATVDIATRGNYYNDAIDWQTGPGCNAAGFFTMFASELSVFTLTAITVERWHTITHALRLDRKIRLRHACVFMAVGWLFSALVAVLPIVEVLGVSSYTKASICLPMDVDSALSQAYVVSLLVLNMLAFSCVCGCYLSIYLSVRNRGSSAPPRADTHVAKRMAVLIFTDFLCMAPISFFAVSAALKRPLITVSDSKLLLVLFYPLNSCANPFLYAFFTRTFRHDFVSMLAARFGVCKARAQVYRTESSSCQQAVAAWTFPKTTLYSLANSHL